MVAMKKKPNPFLEKREERLHRDLDRDGEKGESAAHRAKVLGGKSGSGKKAAMKACGHPMGKPCEHDKEKKKGK